MAAFSIEQKRFIVTGLFVLATLGFLGFFQESSRVNLAFQSFIVTAVFFLVVPALYCKMVLKEPLKHLIITDLKILQQDFLTFCRLVQIKGSK